MKRITDETMFLRKSAAILVSLALVSCGGSSGDGGASLVDSVETARLQSQLKRSRQLMRTRMQTELSSR